MESTFSDARDVDGTSVAHAVLEHQSRQKLENRSLQFQKRSSGAEDQFPQAGGNQSSAPGSQSQGKRGYQTAKRQASSVFRLSFILSKKNKTCFFFIKKIEFLFPQII